MRLRLAALSVALLAVCAGTLPAAASSGDQFSSPRKYYLSLGDSLAFGYQQAKFNALYPNEDPAAFNTGYTDDFAALLRAIRHNGQTVDYGCPGETTDSFINGPCPYTSQYSLPLHNAYSRSSQLATAVDFLRSHPSQVSPITVDIGSNDVSNGVIDVCTDPKHFDSCVAQHLPGVLAQLGRNLSLIVGTLHAAAPRSEIIVLNLYNPVAVIDPASDQFAALINGTIKTAALTYGARVADIFAAFNPRGPAETPTLCLLTAVCAAPLHDTHPTDLGYLRMARAVFQASGYDRDDD